MHKPIAVRAVDVGYGHVKYSEGRHPGSRAIQTNGFPSQSPGAREHVMDIPAMDRLDTHIVEVGGRRFEVGKAVGHRVSGSEESDVLDQDFALSGAYAARLYGALNYIMPKLPDRSLDYLVLGLPMNTVFKHSEALAEKFAGMHAINVSGASLKIGQCLVYPQPLGSYMAFLSSAEFRSSPLYQSGTPPMTLVVDPGYNTVDWFVCRGMVASEARSGASLRGVGAVMRAVADRFIQKTGADAGISEIVRSIDQSIQHGTPFMLYGKRENLNEYMPAGDAVIEEGAQAVKNAIGSGADIDVIVIGGGGATLYAEAFRRKFPKHQVVLLDHPAYANVRGFHILGEELARVANRALGQAIVHV